MNLIAVLTAIAVVGTLFLRYGVIVFVIRTIISSVRKKQLRIF